MKLGDGQGSAITSIPGSICDILEVAFIFYHGQQFKDCVATFVLKTTFIKLKPVIGWFFFYPYRQELIPDWLACPGVVSLLD